MFVSPAFAQTAGAAGGTESILITILPFVAVFAIMYFLIIRPQRRQMKKREEMLKNVRRGDTVITGGGIVAKVTKVMENGEVEVQISEQVKVRVLQSMIADVRVKGEPTAANTK
ncbi:preprotein translocase subunit YajC [Aureimonas populi]|uniref:Sec translocon accessory complex subunit YajC n=1 Tax=Aureimonas populi TaxID=1701758 RepID=A0ABW5CF49_9HYPH|nr:preprotein translocase subunit YajC [Aureimonas populi]